MSEKLEVKSYDFCVGVLVKCATIRQVIHVHLFLSITHVSVPTTKITF